MESKRPKSTSGAHLVCQFEVKRQNLGWSANKFSRAKILSAPSHSKILYPPMVPDLHIS